MNSECDDEAHFVEIAQHIVNYQEYGPLLGVPDQRIQAIRQNSHFDGDPQKITAEVFREWHKMKAKHATYRALAKVAIKLKDNTGARKILRICAKR